MGDSDQRPEIAEGLRRHSHRLEPPVQAVMLCARERLLKALETARIGKLSVIVAPAGYGKTTLLAQWAERLKASTAIVAWVSVSTRESEPIDLLRMIAFALHAGGLDMIGSGMLANVDIAIDTALDAVILSIERSKRGVVIMLDNFELIQSPAATKFLNDLIELLPNGAHLVIAARRRPQLSVSTLRGQGNVRIIEPDELQLTASEVGELLAGQVDETDLASVEQWTEGWPVAVQLYRLWLQKSGAPEALPIVWPVNTIADYLAEQIFETLSPRLQGFLSDILILDAIDPDLADYVRETSDSLEILRELQYELPSFVEMPMENSAPTFRLHPLISRAALAYFRISRERLSHLRARAAAWCLERDRPVEAIRYAVASKNDDLLQRAVERIFTLKTFLDFGVGELHALVRELPRRIRENDPDVQLIYAVIHYKTGFIVEAQASLERMEQASWPQASSPEIVSRRAREHAALELMFSVYVGDQEGEDVDRALDRLGEMADTDPIIWAWRLNLTAVLMAQRGQLREARKALARCHAIYAAHGLRWVNFILLVHDLIVDLGEGSLRAVMIRVGRTTKLQRAKYHAAGSLLAMGTLAETVVSYERGQFDGIDDALSRALEQFDEGETWAEHRAILAPILAEVIHHQNGMAALEIFLTSWQRWMKSRGVSYFDRIFPALRCHYLALGGHVKEAAAIISAVRLDDYDKPDWRPTLWREDSVVAMALIHHHLAAEDFGAARGIAQTLAARSLAAGRLRGQISGAILGAVAAWKSGDPDVAHAEMLGAVRLAYPDGYVAPFVEAGETALAILREMENTSLAPLEERHVDTLIKKFARRDDAHPYGLSNREMAILGHVAEGASNKLIARRMAITENTVKYHLKRVFSKIRATNRRAAAAFFEMHLAAEAPH